MTHVELRDLTYHYHDDQTAAVQGLNLHIPAGQITALLGASAFGKTTTI